MPVFTRLSTQESDNLLLARELLEVCTFARIFAFYGELGAGKTTFIKRCCEALGVTDAVTSPTFNLVHEYQANDQIVYHFDFYRIKSETEAYDMGCDEYFASGHHCFIEWPERIPSLLPPDAVAVHMQLAADQQRTIQVTYK